MKRAIIFGHTSGLGLEVCKCLVRDGYEVVGVARGEVKLAGVTNVRSDLSEKIEVEAAVREIRESYNEFDLLVFAAGMLTAHDLGALDYDDMEYCYRVNLFAPMLVESKLLDLIKENQADVVNVTSSSVVDYYPKYAEYSSSKMALVKFTSDLKRQLQETPCRVIDFCPSGFTSNIYVAMSGEKVERDESKQMKAEDLAGLMVHLVKLPKRIEVSRIYLDRK